MKRFILPAILVFPLAALVFWFYWASAQTRVTTTLPMATNFNIVTNSTTNLPAAAKP
jgi:hypothetical protein